MTHRSNKRSKNRSFLKSTVAAAALIVAGIAFTPITANATGQHQTYSPPPVILGASGIGQGAGMTDGWGGVTGSGPGFRGGTNGYSASHTYGGSDVDVRGRTDSCGFECSDLTAQGNAWGGSSNRVGMEAYGRTSGHGPSQLRIGTDTVAAGHGGAALRFDFPARPANNGHGNNGPRR